ncbi:Transporter [Granulibacter bethesdensis]|nr:thiol reductant ABC exporter subunit CydD [Granulibacter bethesdensis]APH59203.1 Transporter [Granulibacter bethesdensis]
MERRDKKPNAGFPPDAANPLFKRSERELVRSGRYVCHGHKAGFKELPCQRQSREVKKRPIMRDKTRSSSGSAPMTGASSARAGGRRHSPARGWLKEQGGLARRNARHVILLGLTGTTLAVGQAWCLAAVFGGTLGHAMVGGLPYAMAFLGIAAIRAFLGAMTERYAAAAGAAARRRLRDQVMARLLAIGPSLLRGYHSAELAAIAVDRIEALDGFFSRWVPAASLAILSPALILLAILPLDWRAALALLAAGLLVPFGMALSGIGAAVASRRQFVAMSRLQARFLDRVRGIATIVLSGRTEDEAIALGRAADELRRRTMRVLRVAFLSSAVLDLAMAAALVGLALHYGQAILSGQAGHPARALFVLLLVPEFFAPLRAFSLAYQDKMHATGAAEAIAALPAPPEQPVLQVRTIEARGVTVTFDHVSLVWDETRGPALRDVSFRIPAGETVVLAGPSGSGKSSIMEVLLGFTRPTSGRVALNGMDITDIVPAALSRLTAWVGQRPMLFAGTIRDNILFARPEASEQDLLDAIRHAHVDDFARALPDGLETMIGEGGYGLSGGQAQRVAIARAYLRNAPLLLLDEPTSHLDPVTEADILDSLKRLAVGRTVLLASHSAAAHAFPGHRIDLRDGSVVSAPFPTMYGKVMA